MPSRTRPLVHKLQSCCRAVEPQQQQLSSGARELPSKPADLGGNNPRRIVVGRDDGGAMAQIPKDMRAVIAARSGLGVALPTLHTSSHTCTDYLTHTSTCIQQTHTHTQRAKGELSHHTPVKTRAFFMPTRLPVSQSEGCFYLSVRLSVGLPVHLSLPVEDRRRHFVLSFAFVTTLNLRQFILNCPQLFYCH